MDHPPMSGALKKEKPVGIVHGFFNSMDQDPTAKERIVAE